MKPTELRLIVLANAPAALVRVCGITMIDRLLRTLQRAGFENAVVFTATPDSIGAELSRPCWARTKISFEVRSLNKADLTFGDLKQTRAPGNVSGTFVISGGNYFDPRLIAALMSCDKSSVLIDSDPPSPVCEWLRNVPRTRHGYFAGAVLFANELLGAQSMEADVFAKANQLIDTGALSTVDVAVLPSFVVSMRREIRPLWFPGLDADRKAAESLVLDTAQKGAMELVSHLETPIENWLMRRLWDTPITPMQITILGLALGVMVTFAFATGHLWWGVALAFSVGVIDGIDGKQARVKVETTELGRWEPEMDYPIQISWWLALAYILNHTGAGSHAFAWFILFFASDLVDKLFTRSVKLTTGRYIENYSQLDRVIRLFSGQRSLYILMLFVGLLFRRPFAAFVTICCWHLGVTIIHGFRAWWISVINRRRAERNLCGDVASIRY